jgi:hypothetical protein
MPGIYTEYVTVIFIIYFSADAGRFRTELRCKGIQNVKASSL